jgi:dTDP-glucose 4,6-dehydratase
MRRVVVAGAAGFIGSHLVDRLLERGDQVIGIDNLCTGRLVNLEHVLANDRFRFIHADVTQRIPVQGAVDQVFHLASPASPIDYERMPFETLYVGSDGTRELLKLAARNDARFLLASTSEVYGDPTVHPQPESYTGNVDPVGPRSVYNEAKRYAEALTAAFGKYRGLEVRIARLFNTYGPRMRGDDGRVIPNFVGRSLIGDPLEIYGDGTQTRSFCYVSDTVDGLLALSESDLSSPCNIGNPQERTILDLAKSVVDMTRSESRIVHAPRKDGDPTRRRPDITLARTALNWEPTVSMVDGLTRTVVWFAEQLSAGERNSARHGA